MWSMHARKYFMQFSKTSLVAKSLIFKTMANFRRLAKPSVIEKEELDLELLILNDETKEL